MTKPIEGNEMTDGRHALCPQIRSSQRAKHKRAKSQLDFSSEGTLYDMKSLTLKGLTSLLKNRSRLTCRRLEAKDIEIASHLLGEEFANREPLCLAIGLPYQITRRFFTAMLMKLVEEDLSVVLVDSAQNIRGVFVIEDADHLFDAADIALEDEDMWKLNAIGMVLDQLRVPEQFKPKEPGQIFFCNLGAVDRNFEGKFTLAYMLLEVFNRMSSRSFIGGYGKITNPKMVKSIQTIELLLGTSVFNFPDSIQPDSFVWEGRRPFANVQTDIQLVTFPMRMANLG